jgi:hypothetical protein
MMCGYKKSTLLELEEMARLPPAPAALLLPGHRMKFMEFSSGFLGLFSAVRYDAVAPLLTLLNLSRICSTVLI